MSDLELRDTVEPVPGATGVSTVGHAVEQAREHVAPRWTHGREDAVLAALQRRAARRSPWRVLVPVTATLCLVAALFAIYWRAPSAPLATLAPAASASSAPSRADGVARLADGSSATPMRPQTRFTTERDAPEGIDIALAAGEARFEVTRNEARAFRVFSGDVTVTVLGTVFTVERSAVETRVAVERGRVRVAWPGGEVILTTGESGSFPPPVLPPLASASSTAAAPSAKASAAPHEDAEALLRAADDARLHGKTMEAEQALRRVVTQHAGDPRAPVAAFGLGRLYLDQLGRPRDAAQAFATARRGGGALAEDALAREVEAWARAGDNATARARAEEYERLFPKSPRLATVKRLGGVGDPE